MFVYEQPRTGDIFTIADPDLHLNQLEAVQRDVAQLLEQDLNPRPAARENPAQDQAAPAENEPVAPAETKTGVAPIAEP
jgi:hypothetical protein